MITVKNSYSNFTLTYKVTSLTVIRKIEKIQILSGSKTKNRRLKPSLLVRNNPHYPLSYDRLSGVCHFFTDLSGKILVLALCKNCL